VVYLNYLSDEGRRQALLGAELLVQPAFYEGFGMQALDALAAGIPLACSKVSSLPEVAGDAAVYFDPHNPIDIKNAMKAVLFDKSLAESLVTKGRERVKLFGWEKCAKETLRVLLESN
jgi:glycosyltransferase involved in cell wall biosynthesis